MAMVTTSNRSKNVNENVLTNLWNLHLLQLLQQQKVNCIFVLFVSRHIHHFCIRRLNFQLLRLSVVATPPSGPVERCQLQYETGHCYNYTARWYYDYENKYCRQFYYGGCGGNVNNFFTKEECEQACHTQQPEPPTHDSGTRLFLIKSNNYYRYTFLADICKLYLHRAPCEETDKRWYYDSRSDECAEFVYEGCLNAGNRFSDKESCEQTCKGSPNKIIPVTEGNYLIRK